MSFEKGSFTRNMRVILVLYEKKGTKRRREEVVEEERYIGDRGRGNGGSSASMWKAERNELPQKDCRRINVRIVSLLSTSCYNTYPDINKAIQLVLLKTYKQLEK